METKKQISKQSDAWLQHTEQAIKAYQSDSNRSLRD
jgi:hypothetical protein